MSADAASTADPIGAATLETMAQAHRYNAWQVARIAPFLGQRICEIGSGIGNISRLLADRRPQLLVLTDQDPGYLDRLRTRFAPRPGTLVEALTLPDGAAAKRFGPRALDTVVALNVLEHLPDDAGSLSSMAALLSPGGRVVLLVPALPILYGSLDRELGHVRRYDRAGVRRVLADAGLRVIHLEPFNVVGALGWLVNARVLNRPQISPRQLAWFDRLVPLLRLEDRIPLPFGQSFIAVGACA